MPKDIGFILFCFKTFRFFGCYQYVQFDSKLQNVCLKNITDPAFEQRTTIYSCVKPFSKDLTKPDVLTVHPTVHPSPTLFVVLLFLTPTHHPCLPWRHPLTCVLSFPHTEYSVITMETDERVCVCVSDSWSSSTRLSPATCAGA